MSTFSEEDLATLTAEERAVILDDDGAAEANRKALATIADGDDGDDEDDEDDEELGGDDNLVPVITSADDNSSAQEKSAPQEKTVEKSETFRPQYVAQVPVDFVQQLSKIDADIDALAANFKSGDIDFDEFQAQSRKFENDRLSLHSLKTKAEVSEEMSAQTAMQEWQFTIKKFMKDEAAGGGINYSTDKTKLNDFDLFVKALGSDPANEQRDPEWFLIEANKRVKALHGIAEKPKADQQQKQDSRKPPVDGLPKTLAQVPGGDGPGDVVDEFAHIDRLSGDKLEQAIAAMSPAQREKYMSQA